jgi:hypothetical protein
MAATSGTVKISVNNKYRLIFQQNLKKFIAGFDFDARSPDELSFRDGDIIEVDLEKECEPEWFYGHLNGQSGLFPQPYVTAMEDDSQAMNSSFTPVGNQFGEMNLGQQAQGWAGFQVFTNQYIKFILNINYIVNQKNSHKTM